MFLLQNSNFHRWDSQWHHQWNVDTWVPEATSRGRPLLREHLWNFSIIKDLMLFNKTTLKMYKTDLTNRLHQVHVVHEVSLPQIDGELRGEHSCQNSQSVQQQEEQEKQVKTMKRKTHLSIWTGFLKNSKKQRETGGSVKRSALIVYWLVIHWILKNPLRRLTEQHTHKQTLRRLIIIIIFVLARSSFLSPCLSDAVTSLTIVSLPRFIISCRAPLLFSFLLTQFHREASRLGDLSTCN